MSLISTTTEFTHERKETLATLTDHGNGDDLIKGLRREGCQYDYVLSTNFIGKTEHTMTVVTW